MTENNDSQRALEEENAQLRAALQAFVDECVEPVSAPWQPILAQARTALGGLGRERDGEAQIRLDDRTMDRILDDLTERAGHPRNSSALGLARWDLKAVLKTHSAPR